MGKFKATVITTIVMAVLGTMAIVLYQGSWWTFNAVSYVFAAYGFVMFAINFRKWVMEPERVREKSRHLPQREPEWEDIY